MNPNLQYPITPRNFLRSCLVFIMPDILSRLSLIFPSLIIYAKYLPSFPCWLLNALDGFWARVITSLIPLIINSLRSLRWSQWVALLLSHFGSWLGKFASAWGTLGQAGCLLSHFVIAALLIITLSSPEIRISRIDINLAHVHNWGPRNWSSWSVRSWGSLRF